ncbi:37S ribosomal protein S8, mitochondrial [Vanrija pseudolonga]|uniref:37S ribosomal protein S8, mitochondrial n=1 Tax=Vanrija pseudolonga TaxID=143232 RepID=A0AAF0Y3Z9_9TREE|nr:37S ribosomal protein S8, mitochondrial [Vanrija pseudolonga]
MSFTTPPHRLISHLKNTSRAALARTSVPYSNAAVGVTSALLRHGLISNIAKGTPTHPAPAEFAALPKPAQRLWVGLKTRNGLPVMRHLDLVSKSSLRATVDKDELGRLLMGKRARNIAGAGTAEIFVIKVASDSSIGRTGADVYMEGWEAYRAGLGGEVICRAS